MRNSTTQVNLDNWREETRVAKIRTNETIADIDSIRKKLTNFDTDINCLEN